MTCLSLEPSKLIHAVIGDFETENEWFKPHWNEDRWILQRRHKEDDGGTGDYPAPTFAELIRVLPRIGEKKGWSDKITTNKYGEILDSEVWQKVCKIVAKYMDAPTELEGMKAVEEYLMKLL